MYEALIFLAMMLFAAMIACLASEVCNLEENITEERREKFRQQAYAQKRKEWAVKGNRRRLWTAYTKENEE